MLSLKGTCSLIAIVIGNVDPTSNPVLLAQTRVSIGLAGRMFTNGLGDKGSIPWSSYTKNSKNVTR